jgi:hypothetical protein
MGYFWHEALVFLPYLCEDQLRISGLLIQVLRHLWAPISTA